MVDLTLYIEVGECHEWTGRMSGGKRGGSVPVVGTRIDGRRVNLSVRREIWLAAGKRIPDGYVVYSHTCCNSRCIRLEHLACAPRGQHLKRRGEVGLAHHMPSTLVTLTRAARARSTTKYTMDQAREVRALACEGLRDEEISRRTGVGLAMVSDIRLGRAWADTLGAGSIFNGWRPAPASTGRRGIAGRGA